MFLACSGWTFLIWFGRISLIWFANPSNWLNPSGMFWLDLSADCSSSKHPLVDGQNQMCPSLKECLDSFKRKKNQFWAGRKYLPPTQLPQQTYIISYHNYLLNTQKYQHTSPFQKTPFPPPTQLPFQRPTAGCRCLQHNGLMWNI